MTAADLRALIQAASPMPWDASECGDVWSAGRQVCDYVPNEPDAALIVALRNHAERFAELLEREEAKNEPKREWTSCRPCDGWDYRVDGVYAGQVWPSSSGEWWWCLRDNLDNGIEPTQLLARAAVEAAVRAGR